VTTGSGLGVRLSWLLRGSTWRTLHVHRCRECDRKFCDEEPGSWAENRSGEFPELCRCDRRQLRRGLGHTNCGAYGPYCPACAARIQEFWHWQRELYRD
jgi:hypothetical protein